MGDFARQGDHVHVVDGVIMAVDHYPKYELDADGKRYDLRDPVVRAARGWVAVVETPPPDDTDTTTHDPDVVLVDGVPTRTWTPRPWLPGELSGALRAVRGQAMRATSVPQLVATVQELVAALCCLEKRRTPDRVTTGGSWRNLGRPKPPAPDWLRAQVRG